MLRYRVSESLSSGEFLRIGQGCAQLVEQHVQGMGVDLAQAGRVLDFGCGCGRTLRWLLRKCPRAEFHGVDVDREAIQWCSQNLEAACFVATNPEPPLPYPSRHFDVIYCFSVFTHLDENMQDQWLAELCRLINPGGVLFLTVHGERAAKVLDPDDLAVLRTTGFVCKSSRKLQRIVPEWYQTAWHSRDYIVQRLSALFHDVRYEVVADGMQDIVLAKRRAQ
jgi:SAM-dependent methyltransferase